MLKIWIASPNETLIGTSSARGAGIGPAPGASTKKSSSTGSRPGCDDEHVAAGAERGQQRLARERREHRAERGVDGVAALAQHVGPDLRA